MLALEDLLFFLDEALDGMVADVEALGDALANRRPDVPGSNTPYVILHHCLGVMEFWGGRVIAGRAVQRDRPAEFVASGPVQELAGRARAARARLAEDLAMLDPSAPPRLPAGPRDADEPSGRTQGGALQHIYEELAQHRGQLEVTRDILRASWARLVPQVPET